MNLWIRSQEKERLVQTKYLDLVYDEIDEENEEYRIYTYIDKARQYLLGTYPSKERALEVLDEIQNKICGNQGFMLATNSGIKPDCIKGYTYCGVYEMPEN